MIETVDKECPVLSRENIQDDIKYLGTICQRAIQREQKGKYFSLTIDHWTSPNDETYSCLTVHWIDSGKMCWGVLAFEVFHGTTVGVELGKDFERVFNEYTFDLKFIVAVVTDTTGNMNTFGKYLGEKGVTHIYCMDRVLHLNAKHAFNDNNLPNSDNAMRAAQSLVEYSTKSTRVFNEYTFDLKFIVAVVTDTTGNMNTFGKYLGEKGVTHIYCMDRVLHLNAKHAFNDNNLPNSDNAMRAAQSLVEYSTKSTQAMDSL